MKVALVENISSETEETNEELLSRFIESRLNAGRTKRGVQVYVDDIRRFIRFLETRNGPDEHSLSHATVRDIEAWSAQMRLEGRSRTGKHIGNKQNTRRIRLCATPAVCLVPLMTWPLLLFSNALLGVIVIAFYIALFLLVLAMKDEEERLNARGETLFPGHKRFDIRKIRAKTDGALLEGIRGLTKGEDPAEVAARLQEATHGGDALPDGEARLCYDEAIARMYDAAGRCKILEWDVRQKELEEAMRWLCTARTEYRSGNKDRLASLK